MEWEDALDALKERLEEVDGITTVLDWHPDITSVSEAEEYMDTADGLKRVNLWFIYRSEIDTARGGVTAQVPIGWHKYTDIYVIQGYYNCIDRDSLIAFNNLVERIRIKFDQEIEIGSGTDKDWIAGPVGRCTIDYRHFGDIPCHYCMGTLPLQRWGATSYEDS